LLQCLFAINIVTLYLHGIQAETANELAAALFAFIELFSAFMPILHNIGRIAKYAFF